MEYTAADLIELLHLEPHPEGGYYAFREASGDKCSYIYYLLKRGEISRWHKLKSNEVWTWHMGGSLKMTLGGSGEHPTPQETLTIGPRLKQGEQFQRMVPENCWQTTRITEGNYVLVSCVVAPAFKEEDCLLPSTPLDNEIYR